MVPHFRDVSNFEVTDFTGPETRGTAYGKKYPVGCEAFFVLGQSGKKNFFPVRRKHLPLIISKVAPVPIYMETCALVRTHQLVWDQIRNCYPLAEFGARPR